MPALNFQAAKINLSFSFDTLTVYPKFKQYEQEPLFIPFLTACSKLDFMMVEPPIYTKDRDSFESCRLSIAPKVGDIRYIKHNDDDHNLYHRDDNPIGNIHYHLNFRSELTREQCNTILALLVVHDIFTIEERNMVFNYF